MRTLDDNRRDDLILAALLLVIGAPFAVYALSYERPLGVDGTLALVCVAIAIMVVLARRSLDAF